MRKLGLGLLSLVVLSSVVFAGGAVNVKVYNKKGYPAKRVNVYGYHGGGISKFITSKEKTDSNGECVLSWDGSDKRLVEIYIAGEKHKGKYYAGKTYVFETR